MTDLLNHFLQKVWPIQYVNQVKCIKKQWSAVMSFGEKLLGLNWKCPFSPFTYPITYKVGFLYFRSLCIRDTVSNKTYQNFLDKRLLRPGSKSPIWQRSQPICCKAKFSQRDKIYLADLKYNITYENIRGKTKVKPIFIPWNA